MGGRPAAPGFLCSGRTAPLSTVPSRGVWSSLLQDYYSGGYYPAQDPALAPPPEIAPDASFIDDEAVS